MTQLLTFIFLIIATVAFNSFPSTPSPRYWNDTDFDSLMQVAAYKTDSALGVPAYLSELERLKQELE